MRRGCDRSARSYTVLSHSFFVRRRRRLFSAAVHYIVYFIIYTLFHRHHYLLHLVFFFFVDECTRDCRESVKFINIYKAIRPRCCFFPGPIKRKTTPIARTYIYAVQCFLRFLFSPFPLILHVYIHASFLPAKLPCTTRYICIQCKI